jgi:thymidylate synthase (FAD)
LTSITATYIDHLGSDLSVVRAARVSFANDPVARLEVQRFEGREAAEAYAESIPGACLCEDWSDDWLAGYPVEHLSTQDRDLIRYLAKHDHWTPFAHTAITLRVSAPVPIRTQCFKHKQGFVENEESRRYIKSTPEVYFPEVWRKAPPEGGAKQGSEGEHPDSRKWRIQYERAVHNALTLYEDMIYDDVCPEQARFVLPQGVLVSWYWTGSLAAYARFYQQRTDPHAQKEIQDLAKVIGGIIGPLYPVSWKELTK